MSREHQSGKISICFQLCNHLYEKNDTVKSKCIAHMDLSLHQRKLRTVPQPLSHHEQQVTLLSWQRLGNLTKG